MAQWQGTREQSRARLTLTYGQLFKRWATLRYAAWNIDAQWTPHQLLLHIGELRAASGWHLPETKAQDVKDIDWIIRMIAGCGGTGSWDGQEDYLPRSIPELVNRVGKEIPGLKPGRIRYLVSKNTRTGLLWRVGRGTYERAPYRRDRVWDAELEAQWAEKVAVREANQLAVFLCHYLLPHLKTYRKLRDLEISERTYYYWLSGAIDDLSRQFSMLSNIRRKKVAVITS
jgi:hypothetical protein